MQKAWVRVTARKHKSAMARGKGHTEKGITALLSSLTSRTPNTPGYWFGGNGNSGSC